MSLFQLNDYNKSFLLHSGEKSKWIINCHELSDDDLVALSYLGKNILEPYGSVIGIPKGGLRFAEFMKIHRNKIYSTMLIVDDVYTTGESFNDMKSSIEDMLDCGMWSEFTPEIIGLAIFSRREIKEDWIKSIFSFNYNWEG